MQEFLVDFKELLVERTRKPERMIIKDKEYIKKQHKFDRLKRNLSKILTDKENELLDKLFKVNDEMDAMCNEVYYRTGFVDGIILKKSVEQYINDTKEE